MTEYRLHCLAQSGNCYKVALMLNLCGADWEPVFVDFFKGAHRLPGYLSLNPMGEAPTLEGPDGVITQSGAILANLARRFGKFAGETDAERDQILRWMFWDNHKLTGYASVFRFMKLFLSPEKRDAAVMGFLDDRRRAAMRILEARLVEQHFVATPDRPTIADISCCGYMYFLNEIGEGPSDWPNVAAWLDRLKALSGWEHPYALMPGHPFEPNW